MVCTPRHSIVAIIASAIYCRAVTKVYWLTRIVICWSYADISYLTRQGQDLRPNLGTGCGAVIVLPRIKQQPIRGWILPPFWGFLTIMNRREEMVTGALFFKEKGLILHGKTCVDRSGWEEIIFLRACKEN